MAGTSVGFASSLGVFSTVPVVGWAAGIAAGFLDSYLSGRMAGKGRSAARAPRLLDSPVGSNEPGAPRITAYGIRVRVPCHTLWQDRKTREVGGSHNKAGTQAPQNRVYFDALLALNDRETTSLAQLWGNGKFLLTKTRNLTEIRTSAMTVSMNGAHVVLTMGDTADPDFSKKFNVGDAVEMKGFIIASGFDINEGYWKVFDVKSHTSSPSSIELVRYSGQNIVTTSATAGTRFSPATLTRIDDRGFCEGGATADLNGITVPIDSHFGPDNIFDIGTIVRVTGLSLPGSPSVSLDSFRFRYVGVVGVSSPNTMVLVSLSGIVSPGGLVALTGGASEVSATVYFETYPRFTLGIFPPTFDPDAHFHTGSEDQQPNSLLASAKPNAPAFRGMACQGLDDFFVHLFGDQLPYSLEAVIDPDPLMTWSEALASMIADRSPIPATAINVDGVVPRPFLGCYLRSSVPLITLLQPLLFAGSILEQERDGVICMFDAANCDVVEIRDSEEYSHLAARVDGDPSYEKWTVDEDSVEDRPTYIGVRHQDPDNGYADGFQPFKLRHPAGVEHEFEREIDLSNVVLTRKDAAELAQNELRRAWISKEKFHFVLTANYLHLLENDVVPLTDDDGITYKVRLLQRDLGSDFRVHCIGIVDDASFGSLGSVDTESAAGIPPRRSIQSVAAEIILIDAPAIRQEELDAPGLRIAIGALNSSPWVGVSLWESFDGTSYQMVDTVGTQAIVGTLQTQLGFSTAAESVGTTDVTIEDQDCDVLFTNYGAQLIDGCTTADVIAGKNWCALLSTDGSVELAAFTTVENLGDNIYRLGGWLRGLRGTGPSSKAISSRLVMLTGPGQSGVNFRKFAGQITPKPIAYKVVPSGFTIDDVEPISIVCNWRNVLPLPVRVIEKTIDADDNARFTVIQPWTRAILPLGAQPPHHHDERVESYKFTIYDPTGRIIRREFTIKGGGTTGTRLLRDRWITYDSANQSQDGYTPGPSETFWIDIQQVGEFGLGPSIKQEI